MQRKKLHILMLPSWYLPEGGHFCQNQATALQETGHKVHILANVTLSWKKYKWGILKHIRLPFLSVEEGMEVLRNYFIPFPKLNALNGRIWSCVTMLMFRKYIKSFGRPDLIHVHSALWGGYAAYKIKRKYNIPYIITEHKGIYGLTCEWAKQQFPAWQTPYLFAAFSNANEIVVVSNAQTLKIKEYLTAEVPVQCISNVVDTDFYSFRKRTFSNKINFIATNGFYHVKAYDILIPAFDKACEIQDNIYITIVGENFEGNEFEKLWNDVRNKNRFRFTGELDKYGVREELWKANAYIIASRVESQSVSTLEALSTGLPVVCTEVIPDYIVNEKNAIIVPVEKTEELTDAILKMCSDYQTYDYQQISVDIKKIAGKESLVKNLYSLYSRIIDGIN